jgi:DNA-binding transcriptional MerR regulator
MSAVRRKGHGKKAAGSALQSAKPLAPEKLFYKIGDVSRLTGLEPYILRYWETEFPALRPQKNSGGQRVYLRKDIDLILRIKQMLHQEGYTILGAKKKLKEDDPTLSRKKAPELLNKVKTELQDILKDMREV